MHPSRRSRNLQQKVCDCATQSKRRSHLPPTSWNRLHGTSQQQSEKRIASVPHTHSYNAALHMRCNRVAVTGA
jgi:hypothetical protein